MKRTGGSLPVNSQERANLVLCRELHERFCSGDYRMTKMEYKLFRNAAYWVQRQDRLNKGHPERPPDLEGEPDKHAWRMSSMPIGTYGGLLALLADGMMDRMQAPDEQ